MIFLYIVYIDSFQVTSFLFHHTWFISCHFSNSIIASPFIFSIFNYTFDITNNLPILHSLFTKGD